MGRPKIGEPVEVYLSEGGKKIAEEAATERDERRGTFLRKLLDSALILYKAGIIPIIRTEPVIQKEDANIDMTQEFTKVGAPESGGSAWYQCGRCKEMYPIGKPHCCPGPFPDELGTPIP